MTACHCSGFMRMMSVSRVIPALFTSTSTVPQEFTASLKSLQACKPQHPTHWQSPGSVAFVYKNLHIEQLTTLPTAEPGSKHIQDVLMFSVPLSMGPACIPILCMCWLVLRLLVH